MRRSRKTIPRDILEIAFEQIGDPEPSIVFDCMLDAALRALRPLPHSHPRRVEVLNLAMDRLYSKLTEPTSAAGGGQRPELAPVRLARQPAPVLKSQFTQRDRGFHIP